MNINGCIRRCRGMGRDEFDFEINIGVLWLASGGTDLA